MHQKESIGWLRQLKRDISITVKLSNERHTVVQRPGITPIIESRCQSDRVERCRYICDDPKYQPKRHPVSANDHSNVFARESQCNHANKIQDPCIDISAYNFYLEDCPYSRPQRFQNDRRLLGSQL